MWAGGRDYQAEEAEDERIASGQWVERVPPYIVKLNQKQHPTKNKHFKLKYSRWMFLPDQSGKVRIMGRSDMLPTIKEETLEELKEIMEEVDRIEDKVKTKILDLSESLEELEEIKEEVERLEKEIKDKDERKFNNSGIIDISTDLSDEEDEAPREIYLVKESMKRVLLNKTKTSFGLCIMDSGYEKECAGVQWTEEFIANLSKEDQNKVEKVYDGQKFRFSGRQVMTSLYSVKVPFYIGGIWFYMAWSVMDLDLPLLMSLQVALGLGDEDDLRDTEETQSNTSTESSTAEPDEASSESLNEVSTKTDESSEASADDDIDKADLGQDTDPEASASGPEIFAEDARGRFKPGENVQIYFGDEGIWRDVKIRSCYRKNKQKNPGSKYNVVFTDSDSKKTYLYDFNEIAWHEPEVVVEPNKVRLTSSETHSCMVVNIPFHQHGTKEVVDAKRKELDKLKSFRAFIEVNKKDLSPEQRSTIVSTTWAVVFKPQGNNGEGLTKARLC